MFCKYCGNELTDDAVFCSRCGKAVNEGMTAAKKRHYRWKRIAYAAIVILFCLCLYNAYVADSAAQRAEEAYQMAYDTIPYVLSRVSTKMIYDNCLLNGITSVRIDNAIIAVKPYPTDIEVYDMERRIEGVIRQRISNIMK